MAAVALLSPANVGQDLEDVYLMYKSVSSDITIQMDNGWWGRAADLTAITAMDRKRVSLTLDFGNVIPSPVP